MPSKAPPLSRTTAWSMRVGLALPALAQASGAGHERLLRQAI